MQQVIDSLSLSSSGERRWSIALKNPVAGARYLKGILDSLVEFILLFDIKKQRPYRGGAIFGVIE